MFEKKRRKYLDNLTGNDEHDLRLPQVEKK